MQFLRPNASMGNLGFMARAEGGKEGVGRGGRGVIAPKQQK